jgi:hypothetical protein
MRRREEERPAPGLRALLRGLLGTGAGDGPAGPAAASPQLSQQGSDGAQGAAGSEEREGEGGAASCSGRLSQDALADVAARRMGFRLRLGPSSVGHPDAGAAGTAPAGLPHASPT